MATYRCLSCGGLFLDPQLSGVRAFHACPSDRVNDAGDRVPIENRRDENITQDEQTGQVRMKRPGKGRELVAEGDVLSGATVEQIADLQHRPAVRPGPLPEEEHPAPKVWIGQSR